MSEIGEAIQSAIDYLKANRDEARYTDSAAVASLENGLKVRIRDPEGRSVSTDMTTGIGGANSAPSPGWLFRAALASCDATLIAMRAAMLGVELTELEVTIDSESDDYGILGIDESVPAGPLSVRTRVKIRATDGKAESMRELVEWALEHCPVADATKRAVPMTVDFDGG